MFIKSITLEGIQGDIEIARTDTGALVTAGRRVICEVGRDENREARYAKALEVAKVLLGTDRRGRVNAAYSEQEVHGAVLSCYICCYENPRPWEGTPPTLNEDGTATLKFDPDDPKPKGGE